MNVLRKVRRSASGERGAVAVVVAMCAIILFGMAAMAVDITQQVNKRQELHDTIDEAAHAGAYDLPATTAEARAVSFATGMDPDSNPVADFFCIVASVPSGASFVVQADQIPATCNPGPAPYNVGSYAGLRCNSKICAIPCEPSTGGQCNTIRVTGQKPVPFGFARSIGITQGSTGTVSSAACKGSCGGDIRSPMDLVIVGDRTGSMGSAIGNLSSAIAGVLGMLDPAIHHVALGTIGESASASPTGGGNTAPPSCRSEPASAKASGLWVPVGFSNDYASPTSELTQAVTCLGNANSGTGTYLAAPLRTAQEVIANSCVPAVCSKTGLAPRAGVKKAIVFMTDGEPNEQSPPGNGYPWSNNGETACNNAKAEAAAAKAAGTIMVTIAFRLEGVVCQSGGTKVTQVLAAMASNNPTTGQPSMDDGGSSGKAGCNSGPGIAGENADGDFFFCTPTPSELSSVFKAAVSQITGSIRLLRLP